MKRGGLFLLAAAALAIAISGSAGAADAPPDLTSAVNAQEAVDPTIDAPLTYQGKNTAVGGFQGTEGNKVAFSADSGSVGQDPKGHLSETRPHFFPSGSSSTYQGRFRVICLAVLGNEAAVGLVPTNAASNDTTNGFVLAVRDNGQPNGTGDQYGFVPGVSPATCGQGLGEAVFSIANGNVNVRAATS